MADYKVFQLQDTVQFRFYTCGDEATADVHFVFDGTPAIRLSAHKVVLAGNSSVFETMFFGALPESGDVKIVDVDASIFQTFLQMFYYGGIIVKVDCFDQLLYLLDKYNVAEGLQQCETYLLELLDNGTMCWGYGLSLLYNLMKLQKYCEEKVQRDTQLILMSDSFASSTEHVVQHIFAMNKLNCTEVNLFEAAIKWIDYHMLFDDQVNCKCSIESEQSTIAHSLKLQQKVKQLVQYIRFPTMTINELNKCLDMNATLLSAEEEEDIRNYILNKTPLGVAQKFSTKKRLWKFPCWSNSILHCERYAYAELDHGKDVLLLQRMSRHGRCVFSSSKAIRIVGVVTFPLRSVAYNAQTMFLAKFKFLTKVVTARAVEYKQVAEEYVTVTSERENIIKFRDPITIPPLRHCQLQFSFIQNPSDFYIDSGVETEKRMVHVGGVSIRFHTDQLLHDYMNLYANEHLYLTSRIVSQLLFERI